MILTFKKRRTINTYILDDSLDSWLSKKDTSDKILLFMAENTIVQFRSLNKTIFAHNRMSTISFSI